MKIYIKMTTKHCFGVFILIAFLAMCIICATEFFAAPHSSAKPTAAAASATAADTSLTAVTVPIIMYHGILQNSASQGLYVISPTEFEEDLKTLCDSGCTTVVIQDLIDFVYNGKPLPKNPIVITFDDGYYNNYVYAYPLLKKYNCKMVLSPVCAFVDKYTLSQDLSPAYGICTWQILREMEKSGVAELQNHSYDMHTTSRRMGIKKRQDESEESYNKLITEDLTAAQKCFEEHTQKTPTTFTYPFGAVCPQAKKIVKAMKFKCSLSCTEKTNLITQGDKDCLYDLGRFLRSSSKTSKSFFEDILKEQPT